VRYRRRHHVDILVTIGALVLLLALIRASSILDARASRLLFVASLLLLVQPYTLLRLVGHFRPVPLPLRWAAIACSTLGTLLLFVLPRPRPIGFLIAAAAYFVAIQGYAAWAFLTGAARTAGITRWRLRVAGAGATIVTALVLLEGTARYAGSRPAPTLQGLLAMGMVACYYFGLATPRWVRRSLRRAELYRFLKRSAERPAIDREQHVAADLSLAVMRGVMATTAAVLLGRDRLTVAAGSDPAWANLTIEPGDGLLGRAHAAQEAIIGTPRDCEPALRDRAAGEFVAILPIATASHRWGVLVVVQRREPLFLQEDLDLLGALCRQAADVLDHARLLNEEREREKRKADARVRASESRLAIMVDSLTDYTIVMLDEAGRITTWNRGAEQMFGYAAQAIVGQPASRLLQLDEPAFAADLDRARRGDRVAREGPCRRQDGRAFLGSSLIRRLLYEEHDFGGFVMLTRDITEQRRLEERVSQGQKMEAVGRLAAGVAHDFNNLLTVILGFAALNETSLPAGHRLNEDIIEIRKAAERAAALVRQLLAFSRKQVVEPQVIHIPLVIGELLPMLRRLLGSRNEIVEDVDRKVRPVLADPNQLEQIIVNLAINARDAMPNGGRLTLRVGSAAIDGSWAGSHPQPKPGPYIMVEVADTGTGMDAATLAHIFEPFFTTKEIGQGTGLGLATVYGLVQQMGGAITAYSEPGLGTSFKIFLPEAAGTHAVPEPRREAAGPGGTETILLAEDEAPIRRFVVALLERAGYQVIQSGSPTEAIDAASRHPGKIDLLVTDMIMPGGTGPDLVERMRAVRPDVPVLYVSGNADLTLVGRSDVAVDPSTFLQKPFTANQLLSQVRRVIDAPRRPAPRG
jgi:PAS domain S-box-containing protein